MMKTTVLFSALILALSACSKETPPAQANERPALTQRVGNFAGADNHVYSGEVRARQELALAFRVGGKITQRAVDTGSRIKAGQVLARLDSSDAALQVHSADAQLQFAEAEVKRYRVLLSKNFVSQSALDAKEATLKSLLAQAGLAHNQSAYTNLVAEKNGVVMATLAEVGQVVGAGQAVLKVAQDGEREIAVAIPEAQFGELKIGMKADVALWADNGTTQHFTGRLRELAPAADSASRTYAARISLPDNALPLGMTAQVSFSGKAGSNNALIVPLTAIFQQGQQAAVWIVAADRSVSLRPVQVAKFSEDGALIVSGLQAGERIVSNGVHKIVAGEKIRVLDQGAAQ